MITWKSCLYKLSIFAACALLNGQSAAQQAMPVPAQAEPVVVTGQASSIRKALLAQDASNPITSVVVMKQILFACCLLTAHLNGFDIPLSSYIG